MNQNRSAGHTASGIYHVGLALFGGLLVVLVYGWQGMVERCGKSHYFISSLFVCLPVLVAVRCALTKRSVLTLANVCALMLWLFNGGGIALARLVAPAEDPILLLDFYYPTYLPLSANIVAQAMVYSLGSVALFLSGAGLFEGPVSQENDVSGEVFGKNGEAVGKSARMQWIGWGLLLISVVPWFTLMVRSARLASAAGYMGLFSGGGIARGNFAFLASGFVPACFLLVGAPAMSAKKKLFVLALLVGGTVPFLWFGDRGLVFSVLVAGAWLWNAGVRKLRMSELVLGAAALLLLSRSIFLARLPGDGLLSLNALIAAFEGVQDTTVNALSELGGTLATTAYTFDFVPTTRSFECGMSYVYAAMSAVPSAFFSGGHPTMQRGEEAAWLIRLVSPRTAAHGGGLGFSVIAEAYLNFGVIWGGFFMGVLGVAVGLFSSYVSKKGCEWRLAFGASFLTIAMLAARGESLMIFRRLLFLVAVPIFVIELSKTANKQAVKGVVDESQ